MLIAYLNYPNRQVTLHRDAGCSEISKNLKAGQRNLQINAANVDRVFDELADFRFASVSDFNDVWFTIDFGNDAGHEEAVVRDAARVLSRRYGRLREIPVDTHC